MFEQFGDQSQTWDGPIFPQSPSNTWDSFEDPLALGGSSHWGQTLQHPDFNGMQQQLAQQLPRQQKKTRQRKKKARGQDTMLMIGPGDPQPKRRSVPKINWESIPPAAEAPVRAHAKAKNPLLRGFLEDGRTEQIRWPVGGRRLLRSSDTQAMSLDFKLGDYTYAMIVKPRVTSEAKGGASFAEAQGWGTVSLRCQDTLADETLVPFRMDISRHATIGKSLTSRGPVMHDFAKQQISGLPKGEDEWLFTQVVDKVTDTFYIVLEVLPVDSSVAPSESL